MTTDIDYIQASDGVGEAVRGAVTVKRTPGATTLTPDSVANYPDKFIATTGLQLSDGTLDPSTVQVFKGHLSAQNIIIDEFAPGYTDLGNSVGDIVVLKPTTLWADVFHSWAGEVNDTITRYHSDDIITKISATQPTPDPTGTILWIEPLS